MKRITVITLLFLATVTALGQDKPVRTLPRPDTEGGMPLMAALKARQTGRAYTERKLSDQVLSNLLWAACGVNRESGKRTAPSAHNWQEIDIYVVLEKGAYLFDAKDHALKQISNQDLRGKTGSQDFVANAPLNLVYVSDTARMKNASEPDKRFYSGTDTGFISQNVYLFCASEGLATVVRGDKGKSDLPDLLGLQEEQFVVLTQTVGYPASSE